MDSRLRRPPVPTERMQPGDAFVRVRKGRRERRTTIRPGRRTTQKASPEFASQACLSLHSCLLAVFVATCYNQIIPSRGENNIWNGERKRQHGQGRQLTEATDVFIHLISGFGAKEAGKDEPDSKPSIGETSRARLETVESTEDVLRGKNSSQVDCSLLCERITSKSCKHQVKDA